MYIVASAALSWIWEFFSRLVELPVWRRMWHKQAVGIVGRYWKAGKGRKMVGGVGGCNGCQDVG